MSSALGYLLVLLPMVAVAWIGWRYRRRSGDKEARSREREAALVSLAKAPSPVPVQGSASSTAAAAASPAPAAELPVAVAELALVSVEPRDRFLSHSETLIYFLLRTAIPGHEVFPRVSLDSVVANTPPQRPAGSPAHDLDFVVCDKRMRIVAAIQVKGCLAGPDSARVVESLATAGIKLVTVDPRALPKRDELGALVLGSGG